MKEKSARAPASVDNIYKLDGRVPVGKAIPFGLQHVLAMFVANVTPVMLIAGVAVYNGQAFTAIDTALLIQAAMLVAVITLAACLIYHSLAKGFWKQLYVLFGLIVGYVVPLFFGMVDFASMKEMGRELGIAALPKLFAFTPKFEIGAIISVTLVFLVSAAETIGDTSAVCTGGLGREITEKEVSGSLACDGFLSAVSGGVFGCPPITSFSQNVGLVAMTKVVNRFTIMFGALTLILAGLFPPVGAFFSTLPDCVLGGCTVIMFGAIIVSGVTMLGECGFDQRNTIIAATSFAIGIGVTQVPAFFSGMPQIVSDIFAGNPVAGVFVVSMILSLTLPKKVKPEDIGALTEQTLEGTKED